MRDADPPDLPFRPHAGARVRWPGSPGPRFVVTVDVEEEFDWSAPFSAEARAVTAMRALPAADQRLRDGGALPIHLADHPAATDPAGAEILRELAARPGGAVGSQLHSWVTPPEEGVRTPLDSFAGTLPIDRERAKIATLTRAVATATGRSPRVFRAGRYGIGPNTAALLAEHGYRIDTSIRARFDYAREGGPNFAAIAPHPFRIGPGGALLELPLTTVFTGVARAAGPWLFPRLPDLLRGGLARAGLLSRVPLTPEGTTVAEAIEAIAVAAGEGLAVLTLAFHSPSLVPGHTPYVRDAAELAIFWRWWDRALAELARRGIGAARVDDLLEGAAS